MLTALKKWEAHKSMLRRYGFDFQFDTVLDFGFGAYPDVGVYALLNGAKTLYALDIRKPKNINSQAEKISESLSVIKNEEIKIHIQVPWRKDKVPAGSVDFLFSTHVMSLVSDLRGIYKTFYDWLKPGGVMSLKFEYPYPERFHKHWATAWTISVREWEKLKPEMNGRNRLPFSFHIEAIKEAGFNEVFSEPDYTNDIMPREKLAKEFQYLSDEDLRTRGGIIIARRSE